MTEDEMLDRMVAPGTRRRGKYREGVVQIHATRACDRACFGCTQGSQLSGPPRFISVDGFRKCVESLKGYFGVVGLFGGNPALHPKFSELCEVLRALVPPQQRGIWCNDPMGHAAEMRRTFDPSVSNLNVHMNPEAFKRFREGWPEAHPVGVDRDSRHSPPYAGMRDLGIPEPERHRLIASCDINQHWSAMCGEWRGQPRAWFCEVAGAQAIMHQDEEGYPDTGVSVAPGWWQLPMHAFREQVARHCHDCGVPLRGRGELACSADGKEQVSAAHAAAFKPKRKDRRVELVMAPSQLGGEVRTVTAYLQNAGMR